jgi:hypothetical protein
MIFASLFPISNSTYSLLYFQAILLIFVSALAIWAIRTISPDRSWVFLGLTFTLMLYFSNPNGPQQFPSTSVMRFGPSVIIFILLSMSQGYSHSALVSKVLPISGAVAMLWSFESFFYTSMIFAGWVLCYEHTAGHSLMRKLQVFSTIFKVFPATVSIIFLYCTYVFIEVGKLPTLQWFYLFASEYAKGFGQLPIDPWGSGQLFIAGIFACTLVLSVADPRTRPICGAGLGGLLGWLTYFVGRASPSNIVNMFPLVFIAVLIPTLSLRRSLNSQNAPKNRENSPKNSKPDSLIALRASAAILLAFGALFIASFGTYSNIPKFVSYYRALPGSVVVEPSAIEMGYQLDALLNSVELRHLPLAYVGNSGSLPPLSEKSWNSLDQYGTWLPLPLALLEAPISHEVRMTVLARRHERFQRDGYLVWDKQRTIAGVAETWIEDLYYSSHSCRVIVDNEFWQLNECIAQPFLRIETGKNSPTYSVME